ncbi:hypothetical protein EW146_g9159 [Bondarzewia mesenterica]|uniref:Uncharacterized protein n=1 Tax=Bondarzewia mesenterica TaxID=1095465 RepID=A0A4S4LAH5_9AGAM|nr:hypothetical protein EW146_g9159 [Bondarzewia mesenterica]
MAHDTPALALSDIIHTMSPSPAPNTNDDDADASTPPPSASPEPLNLAEIESIKKALPGDPRIESLEAQHLSKRKGVIRLTSFDIPQPAQLHAQAETIHGLTRQREYLTKVFADERARWEAERDNFSREAEALIARRSRGGESTYREEELERQILTLDADNKSLRQKISDYHTRLQSLEAEMAQLRPVLLMQPYALTHSFQYSHGHHAHAGPSTKNEAHAKVSRRRKPAQPPPAVLPEQAGSDEEVDELNGPAAAVPKSKAPRGDYYRRRDTDVLNDSQKHKRLRSHKKGGTMLANAQSEHLLLAMRRIGRERASYLSGFPAGIDRERKREDDMSSTIPKTPKKPAAAASGPSSGAIFSPAQGGPALVPAPSNFPAVHTPKNSSQRGQPSNAARNNPQTPLDSLLTAARSISMIEEDDAEEDSHPGPSDKVLARRAADAVASPIPAKRRRLAGATSTASISRLGQNGASPSGADSARVKDGVSRMRSALDILADQAAASSSKEKPKGSDKGKGKGKEKAKEVDIAHKRVNAINAGTRARGNSTNQGVRTRGRAAAESIAEAINRGFSQVQNRSAVSTTTTRAAPCNAATAEGNSQRLRSPSPTPSWLRKGHGEPEEARPNAKELTHNLFEVVRASPSNSSVHSQHHHSDSQASATLTSQATKEDPAPVTNMHVDESTGVQPISRADPEAQITPANPQGLSRSSPIPLPDTSRSLTPPPGDDAMIVDAGESGQTPVRISAAHPPDTQVELESLDSSSALDADAEGEIDEEVNG